MTTREKYYYYNSQLRKAKFKLKNFHMVNRMKQYDNTSWDIYHMSSKRFPVTPNRHKSIMHD